MSETSIPTTPAYNFFLCQQQLFERASRMMLYAFERQTTMNSALWFGKFSFFESGLESEPLTSKDDERPSVYAKRAE